MCSLARIVLRGSKEPLRHSLVVIGVAKVAVRVVAKVLVEAAAVVVAVMVCLSVCRGVLELEFVCWPRAL
jgi:hypothetical protein